MISFLFMVSCEKERETENISRITYYPAITVKGELWYTIDVGGSFTDLGATAKEGESDIEVTVEGSVDTNTPGVYTITYTAVNRDGYSASAYRSIGVISPNVKNTDMSGTYRRNAAAMGFTEITKVSDNFYYCNNVGGVASPDPSLGVYFYHYDTGKLGVPIQFTPGNIFQCTNATVELGVKYSWVVINSGYGAALRTFIKQ